MSDQVTSTAPRHIRTRYMRGGCWAMAHELSKKTGMDLWGLRDDRGDLHHVYVADPERGIAIDIRGGMPMEKIAEGCQAQIAGPASLDEILRHIGSFEPAELREARKVIQAHLSGLPKASARQRVDTLPNDGPEP
ncbi:MAG: hypothetical protein ABJN42_24785 [Roseibium sp.]|uniref:hypothetical protein n=1 Tax=Roseibium sp. TaxID=1936156 RepID=UPI0032969587